MVRDHRDDYRIDGALRCERALVTLVGDIGPWSERIVLVGGLAPRYIVGEVPQGVSAHIGTTDVDLVIGLAIDDASETYATLQANLKKSGFKQTNLSYQWEREVDGVAVKVEFLCETDQVEPGSIYRPREGTGSKVGAFNVPGAQLTTRDFVDYPLEADRLDDGGRSSVTVRVAGVLAYTVLKTLAFQDRHDNKDAYDLVFTLLRHPGGPSGAAEVASSSPIRTERQVVDALELLAERFAGPDQDGPSGYANFLADPEDDEAKARLRNEAVATIAQFINTLGSPEV